MGRPSKDNSLEEPNPKLAVDVTPNGGSAGENGVLGTNLDTTIADGDCVPASCTSEYKLEVAKLPVDA